ncbi:Cerato-platanin [Boletus coccyginus]|nr:Cerato-platanin [Boletus coccyginus]
MKLFAVAATTLACAIPVIPQATYIAQYDTFYDQGGQSLNSVACSTGEHGLITSGFNTFGNLPNFPFIGGAPFIGGWNSINCGSCWEVTYINAEGVIGNIPFTAINTARQGTLTLSLEALNALTQNQGLVLDGVSVTVAAVSASPCAP